MRTIGSCCLVLSLAAVSVACGGTGGETSNTSTVSSSDVAQYRQLSLQVQSAAGAYGQTMAGNGMTAVTACQSVEDQYDAQVRPWISQMVQMSGEMDSVVADHGGPMEADMGCDADDMMQELDRHRSAACASGDLANDRAEAERHVQTMGGYTGHATERCDEILSGMNEGHWTWTPMMGGCEGAGGSGGMMQGGR